ncbi:MAG: hypothetical protein ACXVZO_06505 [Gaiellaceae bacterium]
MRRVVLAVLLVVGLALVIAPFAFSMFSRTSDGEQMMNSFRPIMQQESVDKTVYYMNNVFSPLRPISQLMTKDRVATLGAYMQGMQAMQTEAPKLVPMLAQAMHVTPAQVQVMMAKQYPALAQTFTALPQMNKDFATVLAPMGKAVPVFQQVPPGLDHYHPIVLAVADNVGNFQSVDALPRMGLFPWFFVIPGALIVLCSGWLILAEWRPRHATAPKPLAV